MHYLYIPLIFSIAACGLKKSSHDDGDASQLSSWEHPDEAFRIGRGFDPDGVEQIRGDCIMNPDQYLDVSWKDAQGIKATLSETRITSHEELLKELSFSMSVSGRYTFYSGNANYSKYEKFTSSQDNFTWLFGVHAEVGSRTLKTESISVDAFKPEAKALIEQARTGDTDAKRAFYQMCGTKFVRSVRLGGHINEVLEISAKASSLIREIHAQISAGGGAGAWRASGSASFNSLLQSAERSSMLKREYSQHGGTRINYDMSPENIQQTLDVFAASLTHQNATVIGVELIDWDTIVNFSPVGIADQARRIRLEQLLKELWRHREKLDKVDNYIYWFEKGEISLTDAEIAGLRADYEKVVAFIDAVTTAGQNCYIDKLSCGVAPQPVVITFPPLRVNETVSSELLTTNWKFSFSAPQANFHKSQTGETTSWSSDDLIRTTLRNGAAVDLRTDVVELRCSNISSILESHGPVIYSINRGEPIRYTERIKTYPDGKRSMLSFGYKEGNNCLLLQVYTDAAVSDGLSLSDDSKASQLVRRMAQSVRYNR